MIFSGVMLSLHTSRLLKRIALCDILPSGSRSNHREGVAMIIDEMKARLRSLLHQRDMLAYERDSLELFDLRDEIEDEIRELTRELRKTA